MKKIVSLIAFVALMISGAPLTFAEELNVDPAPGVQGGVTSSMEQQEGPKVIPGMSRGTGAVVAASASILAFAAIMLASDNGSTTSSHHTPSTHH